MTVPTIGRDEQFKQALDCLTSAIPTKEEPFGRCVHFSIVAPPRGGVTTFMKELVVRAQASQYPMDVIFHTITDGLDDQHIQSVFQSICDEASARLDIEAPTYDTHHDLLELSKRFKEQGRLLVLVLDVAEAVRSILDSDAMSESNQKPALFLSLRHLPNLMEDQNPNLAVVVGWDSLFHHQSAHYDGLDVWQRYQPEISLPVDFGEKGWEGYQDVLGAHGVTVQSGPFPGFTRSGIPVGEILDHAKAAGDTVIDGTTIDGTTLLRILATKGSDAQDTIEKVPNDALIAMCLKDQTIDDSHDLYCLTQQAPLIEYCELTETRGYIATEDLYRELGLHPAYVVLSLEKSIRMQFEARTHDEKLGRQVLNGVISTLGGDTECPSDQFAPCLPIDVSNLNLKQRLHDELDIVLWLTFAPNLTPEYSRRLADTIAEISAEDRSSRLHVLLHRNDFASDSEFGGVLTEAQKVDKNTPLIPGKGTHSKPIPERLCSIPLTSELVVEAVRRARDRKYKPTELDAQIQNQVDTHLKRVHTARPPLRIECLKPLHYLIANSYEQFTKQDLCNVDSLDKKTVRAHIDELTKIGSIEKLKGNQYSWKRSTDELLLKLQNASDPSELLQDYSLRLGEFESLKSHIISAYGAHYLQSTDRYLTVPDGKNGLRDRMDDIGERALRVISSLEESKDLNLRQEREKLDTLRSKGTAASTIEELELIILKLLEKRARIKGIQTSQRENKSVMVEQLEDLKNELKGLKATNSSIEREIETLVNAIGNVSASTELLTLEDLVERTRVKKSGVKSRIESIKQACKLAKSTQGGTTDALDKLKSLKDDCQPYRDHPRLKSRLRDLKKCETRLRSCSHELTEVLKPAQDSSLEDINRTEEGARDSILSFEGVYTRCRNTYRQVKARPKPPVPPPEPPVPPPEPPVPPPEPPVPPPEPPVPPPEPPVPPTEPPVPPTEPPVPPTVQPSQTTVYSSDQIGQLIAQVTNVDVEVIDYTIVTADD